MKSQKVGSRHILLLYRRTMGRIGLATFTMAVVFLGAGAFSLLKSGEIFGLSVDAWLLMIGALSLALSVFSFVGRYFAYVQPCDSYLRVVTPLLRFKVSYRRVRSFKPLQVQQLFPPNESSWAQRSFLEPFFGKTAIVMELSGFPMHPILLKMFLPAQMFSPRSTGFVLIIPEWIKLSTELDSLYGVWRQSQSNQVREKQARFKGLG